MQFVTAVENGKVCGSRCTPECPGFIFVGQLAGCKAHSNLPHLLNSAPTNCFLPFYVMPAHPKRFSDYFHHHVSLTSRLQVERVRFSKDGSQLQLTAVDGRRATVVLPNDPDLVDILAKNGVDISVSEGDQQVRHAC